MEYTIDQNSQSPDITKEFILSKVSQEDIFEKYLGIKVQFTQMIRSPLRKDKNPTCKFHYSISGTLYLKDFAGHFWGNCFDVVKELYNCGYAEVLVRIIQDFGLLDPEKAAVLEARRLAMAPVPVKTYKKIGIKIRPYTKDDIAFWSSYGIGTRILRMYNVLPCENVFINDAIIYRYTKGDPAYAYRFGQNEYKVYYPLRRKPLPRFNTNTSAIQGYDQLPETGNLLVITKSMKDVMLLRQWNIISIAPQSESNELDADLIEEMRSRFDTVVLLYDFDYAGVKFTNKARKSFNLPFLFLTNGRFGTTDYGAKDVSDYYKAHGAPMFRALFQKAYLHGIKNYRNPRLHQKDYSEQLPQSRLLPPGVQHTQEVSRA